MANLAKNLTDLVEQEAPLFGLFLVAHTISPAKLFQFYMDSEEVLSMKSITDFTRHISEKIDDSDLSDEAFTFEISSPGAERPLTNRKQYGKHIGRSFDFVTSKGLVSGKLVEINENNAFLIEQTTKEKGKKAITQIIEVPFENIQSATIIISFK
jgi:ribosome maturation factor RimP